MSSLSNQTDLVAVAIIEKDKTGESICAWSYPFIDNLTESVLLNRAAALSSEGCFFSKHKTAWQYFKTMHAPETFNGGFVSLVTVVIISPTFDPEKWAALLDVLAAQYLSTVSPVALLSTFLSVFTTKSVAGWTASNYDAKAALVGGSISELVGSFGVSSVLIWNAMLLKKRIVVVGETAEQVSAMVRVLPQLAWARQNWAILRPLCTPSAAELADLSSAGVYCAGFLEVSGVKSRTELWDLLVDVSSREVVVGEHAKEDFRMGELHKDIASFMVESTTAANDSEGGAGAGVLSDQDLIKGIFQRTSKITGAVKQLCAKDPSLSLETLEAAKIPKSTQRFMYNLALAEGLLS
mmetsp:Transcript_89741/g.179267  ORF Transcript_89741/g.179267 Transcript_89741/m.179267 type:complete len:352 (+) Transcript_89741:157-1212(+)